MTIQKITSHKKDYLDLLLLADEQESMIDRYLERGDLFILLEETEEIASGQTSFSLHTDTPEPLEPSVRSRQPSAASLALAECVVTKEGAGTYEIKNLATRPEHQKKGYARQLIEFLFTYYLDCKTLYVGTGDSPLTIPFYKRCGFQESHRIKNFFTEHYDHPIYEAGKLLMDMVYLKRENPSPLRIRSLCQNDIPTLAMAFLAQGWSDREETLWHYYADQEAGVRYVYVAEYQGLPVGYVTLLPLAKDGPFMGKYPEISDFNILQSWQRRGIGSALLEAAETQAALLADTVSLGVGLHSGYGAAQRLYYKRGYLPDGSGVWYQGQPAVPYAQIKNDDDLILYLQKSLC